MTSFIPGGTFLNLPGLCDLMAPLDVGAVTQKAMEQAHRAGLPDIATIVTNVEKRRNGDWWVTVRSGSSNFKAVISDDSGAIKEWYKSR